MTNLSSTPSSVSIELRESGVTVLRLGTPGEPVVVFNEARMLSLKEALVQLQRSRPPGLIIAPVSEEMFCAGADVGLIEKVTSKAEGQRLAALGQEIFAIVEALPFPTVAAISGPCVGGGCELALACRYRIITEHKSSVIGLPEVQLGIIPGFGGTQRMPRLIGLPNALDIILAGKIVKPKKALSYGLVDELVGFPTMLARAEAIILGSAKLAPHKLTFKDKILTHYKLGRSFVERQARSKLLSRTKGLYPAPVAALDAVMYGLTHGTAQGYVYEAQTLGSMVTSPECKGLVRVFFATEASKSIGKSARKTAQDMSAVVVGAGVMGAGIAGSFARAGISVTLKDTSDEAVARGLEHIRAGLEKSTSISTQEKSFILNRIEAKSKDTPAMANAHFAIEAIFEDMEAKRKLFKELVQVMPAEAMFATNTSSLSVTEMAKSVPHPENFVGMHFFNPVEKMPLVEIIRGDKTADKTIVLVAALTARMGKYPIVVNDVPGFLVNRILTPYLSEAAYLLSEGYSAADIDSAATKFGMPMGPIRLLDEIGLDVAAHVAAIMTKGYGERMEGPKLASKLVALGRKGKKGGSGFFNYVDGKAVTWDGLGKALEIPSSKQADPQLLQQRLILRLVNEAVLCFDEGVAGIPGAEAAKQVDLGSVMGFGFPPFRGGVLNYAQTIGAKGLREQLTNLAARVGPRFAPSKGIETRAGSGKSFFDKV